MKKGSTLFAIIGLFAIVGLFQGCKKPSLPDLTTAEVTEVGLNSAISGGTIVSDGGAEITEKGVCWGTATGPTISGSRTSDGTGTANFVSNIAGLAEGTTYYVRAYATNEVGTAYGNELTFTTNQVTGAVLTTTEVTDVTSPTALAGGNITNAGGGTVTARGICWGKAPNPTVEVSEGKTVNGEGIGTFTGTLTPLVDGTIYYYRAYATNSSGTTYGQEFTFITPVTDIEGNIYKTVAIGSAIWMAENLRVTEFNDDSEIPLADEDVEWIVLNGPGYCWYNNDSAYYAPLYGALYNWYAASASNICPTGWHVATDEEYNTLEVALGLSEADVNIWGFRGTDHGSKMKSTTGWNAEENGTNTSGFTALPGGYRFYSDGEFNGLNTWAYWWTATEHDADRGWYRRIDGNNAAVYRASTDKRAGKAIRCVKD